MNRPWSGDYLCYNKALRFNVIMPNIQEILPPPAVESLPNLEWEYLAEQLWVHAQNFIATGVHVFAGGIVTYAHEAKEATLKLDSLDQFKTGKNSIIEMVVSYKNEDEFELKMLTVSKDQTTPYSEIEVENWSFDARRSYVGDIESDPYMTGQRVALERLSRMADNTLEQNVAALDELNDYTYFHEYIETLASKHGKDPDFWQRLHFGLTRSGAIDLTSDYVDVTESPETYDRLHAMDWLYQLYNSQTPNKPYILINEQDQYIMLHVNENKDDRLFGNKVEIYTGDLKETPLEVGVEIYHGLSRVKRQRTRENFMTSNEEQTYSQSVDFEPPTSEDCCPRPFWNALNHASAWRPATEKDIAKWLELSPPAETPRDGNNQNLLDMYNSAKDTWLQSWRNFPLGEQISKTADSLYDPEDPARLNYLVEQLQMAVATPQIDVSPTSIALQ